MTTKILSKEIRKLLIDAEMTIGELCLELGVHRSTFANAINTIRTGPKDIELLEGAKKHLLTRI